VIGFLDQGQGAASDGAGFDGDLVRPGMLEEERPDDARRVYYERTDSPLWRIIDAAAGVVDPPV
jgi:hypothetical protein